MLPCRCGVEVGGGPEEVRPVTEGSPTEPEEQADSTEDATAGAVRHELLLAKVREANKRSLAPRR